MARLRARCVSVVVVLAAIALAAYASVVATPITASSNPSIPTSAPGIVIFSLRNTDPASSVTITDFTDAMQAVPTPSCGSMSIARLDGQGVIATLAPNEQMQYVASTAGFAAMGQYTCTWNINGGLWQVTTLFNVGSASFGNVDVQPKAMDFGTQLTGSSETQTLVVMNYNATPRTVDVTIQGGFGNFRLGGTACTSMTSCTLAVPASGSAAIPVMCVPITSGAATATVDVGSSGSAFASTSLQCVTNGESISISPKPISIVGTNGQPATATATISSPVGDTLASASISDASYRITACNQSSCTFAPPQALPYTLTIECTPGSSAPMAMFGVTGSSGGSDMTTVTCMGSGSPAYLFVGPVPTFGNVIVGNSVSQMVQLSNTGGAGLTNLAITFPGVNGGNWSASDCVTTTCSLAPSETRLISVTFQPTSHGDKSTMMHLSSTASNDPVDVALSGTGLGGVMVVSPSTVDIGTIPLNQPFSRTIALSNTGNYPYTAMHSTLSTPYSVSPATVQVDQLPQNLTVTCQSSMPMSGTNEQTMTITSDAYAGTAQTVKVHCTIVDTNVIVTPNQLDFGEVRKGTDPNPRTILVSVTNPATSAAPAHLSSMQLRTTVAGLSLSPPMTDTTLPPGGAATATLQLATNADTTITNEYLDVMVDGAALSLPVTGKVVTPSSRVAPQKLDLGTACVGTAVSGEVKLINDGTATLMVDQPRMDGGFTASSPSTPTALQAGMSLSATVSPAMTASGSITGTLLWHDDVPITHMVPVDLEYVATGTALSPKTLDFGILEAGEVGSTQHITLQNCDPTSAKIKVEALRTSHGALVAWVIEPRIGYTKQLAAKEAQRIDVTFMPPARGKYEADLEVTTPAGAQRIHLLGEATGRDFDNTSFYDCACRGAGAPARGWPVVAALAWITFRRRRVSSSPR